MFQQNLQGEACRVGRRAEGPLPAKKWGEASGPCSFTSTSAWAGVSQNCGRAEGGEEGA